MARKKKVVAATKVEEEAPKRGPKVEGFVSEKSNKVMGIKKEPRFGGYK